MHGHRFCTVGLPRIEKGASIMMSNLLANFCGVDVVWDLWALGLPIKGP